MLISCEKCSTTYVLDDKLIPAQGAPVQCTKCQHVFLAKAPDATTTSPAGPTSTQMFGSPDPASAAPPASRTQMFGAAGGGAGPAAANKTVMFGVPGADAPAQPAPAGAANRTMMFGAAGAAPAAAPAPAGAANRTMMFGAAGAETPPPSEAPTAPPPGAPNRTMMFGAPGAEAGKAPSMAAAASKTMVFGAAVVAEPAPPAAAQGAARSTMMFGAVGAGEPAAAPAPAAKPSQTMMFGAATVSPAQPAPPQSTQPPKTSNTMMFGAPVIAPAPVTAPPSQKSSSTMIFGATPVNAPGPGKAPKLTESTVRIGPEDLERMMREHESLRGVLSPQPVTAPTPAPSVEERHNKTQMFAMQPEKPAPAPSAENRSNKTQMFAMQPEKPTPSPSAEDRQNKTQMFAMSAPAPSESLANRRTRSGAQGIPPSVGVDASILDTIPPADTVPRPVGAAGPIPVAPARGAKASLQAPTMLDASSQGGGIDLPPEAPDLMESSGTTQPMAPVEADPAAVLRAQVARRNRIALIIIALVLVIAALAVTWKVFGRMVLSRAPPAAAVEGGEKALSQLRFDDTRSKQAAVEQLVALVGTYPDYIEGHAALVTAVSLQLDDVQQRLRRIEQLVERKKMLVARYNKEKSPANWETTAQTLAAQVDELIKEHKPLVEQGHDLDAKAREAYKGLDAAVTRVGNPTKQAQLAAYRAQALFHGVSGSERAIELTSRYEAASDGSPSDGWIDLALPEYAANARVSDEMMQQAMKKLEVLHKRDSTFLRTYVLSARLSLIKRDLEEATSDLDQVLAMRKEHDVATELREWVRKLPKADDKKE